MDCKECQHLKRWGYISKCELNDNVTQYGEIGNEPIVSDCRSFKAIELGRREVDLYCHWRPIKRIYGDTTTRFLLATDCGRVLEYGVKSKATSEIMSEVCSRCKRLIKVHYIKGMGE